MAKRIVKVTPVLYNKKCGEAHKYQGIAILNRNTNTETVIDVKTLTKAEYYTKIYCNDTIGCSYFTFT